MLSNRAGKSAPDGRLDVDRLLEGDSIERGGIKPTFSEVFAEWTPGPPPTRETVAEKEEPRPPPESESHTDYWIREPGC